MLKPINTVPAWLFVISGGVMLKLSHLLCLPNISEWTHCYLMSTQMYLNAFRTKQHLCKL